MYPDAKTFELFGHTLFVWGMWVALGCLAAGALLLLTAGKEGPSRNATALTCLLAPMLGLVGARLLFVLLEVQFAPFLTLRNALNLRVGGFSMYGALLGAAAGAALSARLARVRVARWLDVFTPALFAFIALARLGEGATVLGISRPLVTGVLDNTFLAFRDAYDAYLRTYLLESAAAVVLCVLSLRRNHVKCPAGTALFGALCYGVTQNLFESLRYDGHMRYSFVGAQQVLSVALFSLMLLYLAIGQLRRKQAKRLAITSLIALPFILLAILGLEFMIDRSAISKWISYALYAGVLIIPLALGLRLLNRSGYNG